MKYNLIMPFGIFYVESDLHQSDLISRLRDGIDIHPIFDSDGNHMKIYPPKFFQSARVEMNSNLIPIDNVPISLSEGRMAMVYPFDKTLVMEVLKKMTLVPNSDSNEALQYFITENVEEFLTNYRNTTYIKGSISKCEISEDQSSIIFYSHKGSLMHPTKLRSFIIGSSIIKFSDSERYELCFNPD